MAGWLNVSIQRYSWSILYFLSFVPFLFILNRALLMDIVHSSILSPSPPFYSILELKSTIPALPTKAMWITSRTKWKIWNLSQHSNFFSVIFLSNTEVLTFSTSIRFMFLCIDSQFICSYCFYVLACAWICPCMCLCLFRWLRMWRIFCALIAYGSFVGRILFLWWYSLMHSLKVHEHRRSRF